VGWTISWHDVVVSLARGQPGPRQGTRRSIGPR
jgi:hypothetical protein